MNCLKIIVKNDKTLSLVQKKRSNLFQINSYVSFVSKLYPLRFHVKTKKYPDFYISTWSGSMMSTYLLTFERKGCYLWETVKFLSVLRVGETLGEETRRLLLKPAKRTAREDPAACDRSQIRYIPNLIKQQFLNHTHLMEEKLKLISYIMIIIINCIYK